MENISQYLSELLTYYAEPAIESLLVAFLALVIYSLFCRALKKVGAKGYIDYQLRIIFGNIIKWFLIIIVILISLGFFGVSVSTLWAALSGVLALVALGFVAVWSVLSNVLCSILLIVFAPFRIGDEIEIQEPTASFCVRGKVASINMLFTSLEITDADNADRDNTILRVPNNVFFQKYVRCIPGDGTESLKKYMARQQDKQ